MPTISVKGKYNQTAYPGYQFMGVAIDPSSDIAKPTVFLAGSVSYEDDNLGISKFGLAIATVMMNENLQIILDGSSDVLPPLQYAPGNCYDIYTSSFKPSIFVIPGNNSIIVAYPGRCSTILKITYNPTEKFNSTSTKVKQFAPVDLSSQYVSSYAYDSSADILYYTAKTYQTPGATLVGFNCALWTPLQSNFSLDLGESEPLLSVASGVDVVNASQRYLFITASGANKIVRMNVANGLSKPEIATAALGDTFNRVSSAVYITPYFYFCTNEPDAQVGRIHHSNFCDVDCGEHGYCLYLACFCQNGFAQDYTQMDPITGVAKCIPEGLSTVKTILTTSTDFSVTFGILFGVTTLVALLGWYLWWKARQNAYRPLL
jgi:hypothetical protein